MSDMPPPLTPPDCDLRDFAFMPVDIGRLFGSEFHSHSTDAEWRAGMTLWLKSYHQVPAASMPDDDISLARAAEFGVKVKAWAKVRDKALRGWVKCSDGRLYHPVVAEKALEGWLEKLGARKSSRAGNAKRYGTSFDPAPIDRAIEVTVGMLRHLNPNSRKLKVWTPGHLPTGDKKPPDGSPDGTPDPVPSGSQQTLKRQGQGSIPLAKANGRAASELPLEEIQAKPAKLDPWQEVYAFGKQVFGQSSGGIITNLRKTFEDKPRKVLAKIQDAADQRDPLPWINAFLWKHGPPGLEGIGPMDTA